MITVSTDVQVLKHDTAASIRFTQIAYIRRPTLALAFPGYLHKEQ